MRYQISFEIYPSDTGYQGYYMNFDTDTFNDLFSVRYSAGKLNICFLYSNESFRYEKSNVSPNQWHSVEICQRKSDDTYVYSIYIDGTNDYNIINTTPKVFNNVKVYACAPGKCNKDGKIRNLCFRNSTIAPELLCPSCDKVFEDPVMLLCSDTFCKACIQKECDGADGDEIVCS